MYQWTRLECIKNEIELGDLVKLSKTLDYAICTCMFAEITYQVNKKNFYARIKKTFMQGQKLSLPENINISPAMHY